MDYNQYGPQGNMQQNPYNGPQYNQYQNMGMMQNGMNMPNVPMNNFYQNPNFMINQMMLLLMMQ